MPDTIRTKNFRSARICLSGGWKGSVSLTSHTGDPISTQQWRQALGDLEKLLSKPKMHLKVDGSTTVAVYDLEICGKTLSVAVKTHISQSNVKDFLRGVFRDKSLRNFKTAAKLCDNGIPTPLPLAAMTQKRGLRTVKTIFITEYIENSCDLYSFLSEKISQIDAGDKPSSRVKKQVASQIAKILARLHGAGMWHRDAKAGNFLIAPTDSGNFEVMLVDMDGIKTYLIPTAKRRYSPFAKLGSVLIWHKGISMTDYLRSFRIYCNLSKVDKHESNKIFRRLCRSAIAMRLLTFARSAIGNKT